jgi:voltage-gated potassium channel
VTTVGYGDRYPTTTEGRFLAVLLMITGISLVGVITASVAAWFVKLSQDDDG